MAPLVSVLNGFDSAGGIFYLFIYCFEYVKLALEWTLLFIASIEKLLMIFLTEVSGMPNKLLTNRWNRNP